MRSRMSRQNTEKLKYCIDNKRTIYIFAATIPCRNVQTKKSVLQNLHLAQFMP